MDPIKFDLPYGKMTPSQIVIWTVICAGLLVDELTVNYINPSWAIVTAPPPRDVMQFLHICYPRRCYKMVKSRYATAKGLSMKHVKGPLNKNLKVYPDDVSGFFNPYYLTIDGYRVMDWSDLRWPTVWHSHRFSAEERKCRCCMKRVPRNVWGIARLMLVRK